jgi:Ser/Thr protein kinase RdoA (MazF antagonist)
LNFLLGGQWIPIDFQRRYQELVEKICDAILPRFERVAHQRIHGDCHLGNLLWNQEGPFFLDFDDMVRGPAVQDLWLIVPGRDSEAQHQRRILLEGYEELRDFDRSSLSLIEPLRALRYINYSTWIARRWSDQAFQQAFPQFGSHQYWGKEVEDLEEQLNLIQALPRSIDS